MSSMHANVRSLGAVLFGVLIACLFVTSHVGCNPYATTDSHYHQNKTIASLKDWGHAIEFVLVNGLDDPLRFADCNEVLAAWEKKGFIEAGSAKDMKIDGRGRPFFWSAKKKGEAIVVMVSSVEGLAVEVTFSKGQAEIRNNWTK